ncbi:Os08g0414000 [Oryza sativa Japonica Group]|uniref:Os08g0414000 protein n=1 Tax=Oryza sativa subsp. japonica TaxID=39947 RepID=A0A0P0XFY9_ORYSJ|nr:Os08g0414000 [Oryza sativa Japonica Group]
MNVTRPLSRYLDNPDAAAERPPEGPGSGFLVVEDEAAVEQAATICCGLCHDPRVRTLPFTQSWRLYMGEDNVVVFVPVVGEPLSAGCYYVDRFTSSATHSRVCVSPILAISNTHGRRTRRGSSSCPSWTTRHRGRSTTATSTSRWRWRHTTRWDSRRRRSRRMASRRAC